VASYEVTVTLNVDITNPSVVRGIGGGSGDERQQVETAVNRGLKELGPIASNYGFQITSSSASVSEA